MKTYITLLFLLLITLGCGDSESSDPARTPTNLVLDVDVSEDGSGKVIVTATADNTNYFDIYFGDVPDESATRTSLGTVTHDYITSGEYIVRAEAHGAGTAFIEQSTTIQVEIVISDEGYTTPDNYDGMTLAWQDEFSGASLNLDDWSYETGGGGWGNNELETYTANNATVADGYLSIMAKKEGAGYTSSRIVTDGKQSFKYGRIDIRAKLPKGQGIWPALWMLGSNFHEPGVGWPKCGEIDIMEMIGGGGKEKTTYGTPHWYESVSVEHASYGGHYDLPSGTFADEFHVFTIIWDAEKIAWYVDDIKFHEIDTTPPSLSEFQEEFFFIFNVAVGGYWPGSPDGSTTFPQRMLVDYVRVFQPQ